jgi:prepilin-type N-terminal cleavage/methylation domain-containing protein
MTRVRSSPTGLVPLARAARRRRRAGFTLIELSVALIAGLLVAMALVQVSKEANNTFHEEVRAAAAEMSLRIALERLRMDLQRASYMSTGNIIGDPGCAMKAGTVVIPPCLSNVVGAPPPGLARLAGIQLAFGGSTAATPLSADPNNGLNPDSIQLAGNYSSTDEFVGHMCPGSPAGGGCGGQTICLEWNTPAMWRIRNTGVNAAATLQSYFNPSYFTNPTAGVGTTQFMARVTDDTSGKYVFVLTCPGVNTTSMNATTASINLVSTTTVLTTKDTRGHGGVGGFGAGHVIISPVEIVSWQLQKASTIPAAGANAFGVTAAATVDPKEYVLTRGYVSATTPVPYAPDPSTLEVVSDYAVDLKFAFTIDNSNPGTTKPPGAYTVDPRVPFALDDPTNATWAPDVSTLTPYIAPIGPHRIRSARVRVAIRAAAPDRIANVAAVPATGQPFMYRYFIPGAANGLQWARVRTGVTETALPNQARFYW